jgi:hypothetical protein
MDGLGAAVVMHHQGVHEFIKHETRISLKLTTFKFSL